MAAYSVLSNVWNKLVAKSAVDQKRNHQINKFVKNVFLVSKVIKIINNEAYVDNNLHFNFSNSGFDIVLGSVVMCILNDSIVTEWNLIDEWDQQSLTNLENYGVIRSHDGENYIVSPGPITFKISEVVCEFLPLVGDMVHLTLKKCLDGLIVKSEITHVFPAGMNTSHGRVTYVDEDWGYISEDVMFFFQHCQPGYVPSLGDPVVFSFLRCCTGEVKFRAFQVTPLVSSCIQMDSLLNEVLFAPQEIIRVFIKKPQIVETNLYNVTNQPEEILELIAHSRKSVIVELIDPKDANVILKPGVPHIFSFRISAEYIGFKSVIFEFIFRDKILKFELKILAVPLDYFKVSCKKKGIEAFNGSFVAESLKGEQARSEREIFPNFRGVAVPGRRFFRPCKFIPVKFAEYKLPDLLLSLFESGSKSENETHDFMAVKEMFPSLKVGLKNNNYQAFFHSLIHLEELAKLIRISQLSFSSKLSKDDDYMILNFDEDSYLSCLYPGDRVYATKLFGKNDVHEGIIWVVQPTAFSIKFAVDFHLSHTENAVYSFSFETSRYNFRLLHQSVDDCFEYFGVKWLFPEKIPRCAPYIIPVHDESMEEPVVFQPPAVSLKKCWNRSGSGYGSDQVKYKMKNELPTNVKKFIRWFNPDLNSEQRAAVTHILEGICRPLPYLIFGPPGTGKTVTVVEAALQIYSLIAGSRIVVAAPSNGTVDSLCIALIDSGFVQEKDLIRLCSNNHAKSSKLARGISKYAGIPAFDKLNLDNGDVPRVSREFISGRRIVVSTFGCLGYLRQMGFPRGYFSHFLVDEASQVTEPECLVMSLFMNDKGHLTLAGDPNQLGPYVLSLYGKVFGLDNSFQKRIMMSSECYAVNKVKFPNSCGYNPLLVTKLVKSYRSLPALLYLPNQLFYSGDLEPMVSLTNSDEGKLYESLQSLLPVDSQIPMIFHAVEGQEQRDLGSCSFHNMAEAFQVAAYLAQIYSKGVDSCNVGIITPYAAQVKQIETCLGNFHMEIPMVGSVDAFQGQEKQVIILSTVRTKVVEDSKDTKPSFVFQPNRINVAITRAKVLLVIIGHLSYLRCDDHWKRIIQYAIENQSFVGLKN